METFINNQYQITKHDNPNLTKILSPEAVDFLIHLETTFRTHRSEILKNRIIRQKKLDNDELPRFLKETESIRNAEWQVSDIPPDLQDRRTEITGPVDKKMIINALNSGAKVFMADFEDSNSPTWDNCINGQKNLIDANLGTITFETAEKKYQLGENPAVLVVRPRGWHLTEEHFLVDGQPISASIFDFGLYLFHNHLILNQKGSGPYYYLPKLESHKEAALWNEIFVEAQKYLDIPLGTIKATVLIETILAAFEMEEIIFELKEHLAGLNAGRWDYIFSMIKKFSKNPDFILPDRALVTMRVPFMKAYTNLLVKTCHKRGAHAIGGMAAFIPNRKNAHINEIAIKNVQDDKKLEAENGFDGTWVAHPDLVPVALEQFDKKLGSNPHQKHILRQDVSVNSFDLLNTDIDNFSITERGIRTNISVAIQYITSWLEGSGAVAINNLMEDAATAEISRAQVWQWLHHKVRTYEDITVTVEYIQKIFDEEYQKLMQIPEFQKSRLEQAASLFSKLVFAENFEEFLTLKAYKQL
jgi:malate synthase